METDKDKIIPVDEGIEGVVVEEVDATVLSDIRIDFESLLFVLRCLQGLEKEASEDKNEKAFHF
jgi:hypothetical protein